MVDPFKRACPIASALWRKTFGSLYVRCDVSAGAMARLYLAAIPRYRLPHGKTFSCFAGVAPMARLAIHRNRARETGMRNYQLDQVEAPQHHPATGRRRFT